MFFDKKGYIREKLTFYVGKCTEGSPGAVAGVLNVVALGGLVDLGMELLLCPVNQKNCFQ